MLRLNGLSWNAAKAAGGAACASTQADENAGSVSGRVGDFALLEVHVELALDALQRVVD